MKIAIITGASSGLGEEYVKCVANGCADIDEIWAIARREEPAEGALRQISRKENRPRAA